MGIDNYLCAKEDVENAAVPSREDGGFSFTNGMMKILERPQLAELRSYSSKYLNLEDQKHDVVVSITDHESTLEVLETENANREKEAQEALEIKRHALAAKQDIKANHERVMRSNGMTLAKDEPEEVMPKKKKTESPNAEVWKSRLRSFAIFVGIETLAFVASYVILRENLNNMEVYTRLIANGTVFFIIDYLLRRKEATGRSVFLVIFLAIYALMLLTPLFAEFLSGTGTPAADAWGFDESTVPVVEEAPGLGAFLLQNASLILVVVAIICLVVFLGFYNKEKGEKPKATAKAKVKPVAPITAPKSEADVMYSSLYGLNRDVTFLEKEVEELQHANKILPMQLLSDFSLLRDTLIGLDQKWQDLGRQQERIRQDISASIDKVMNELKEYQDHYQSMLSGTTNSFVFKPQWPTEQDLRAYYKIEIVA